MTFQQTSFSDVCGTTDELKRRLFEEYDRVASNPEGVLGELVDDVVYMIERMNKRLEEYRALQEKMREILISMEAIGEADSKKAEKAVRFIQQRIQSPQTFRETGAAEIDEAAEEARSVAGDQENKLRQYKDLALKLYDEFIGIKGNRSWLVEEESKGSLIETLRRRYQAWLPSEPHGELLLDWLSRARAVVSATTAPDDQPVVQFEDGGVMPMSQVRWDPEIRNFHPASFQPGLTARQYRGKAPRVSSQASGRRATD